MNIPLLNQIHKYLRHNGRIFYALSLKYMAWKAQSIQKENESLTKENRALYQMLEDKTKIIEKILEAHGHEAPPEDD